MKNKFFDQIVIISIQFERNKGACKMREFLFKLVFKTFAICCLISDNISQYQLKFSAC